MKKAHLLKLLEDFDDDQEVFVELFSERWPMSVHIIIQGAVEVEPWYPGHGVKKLVGICCSDTNRDLGMWEETKRKAGIE